MDAKTKTKTKQVKAKAAPAPAPRRTRETAQDSVESAESLQVEQALEEPAPQPPEVELPRVPNIRGYFDTLGPDHVGGWVLDEDDKATRLQVEVVVDGVVVASVVAEEHRLDIEQAGISDGRCGFRLPMPLVLLDGEEHEVVVREPISGSLVPGSPQTFQGDAAATGEIALEHSAIKGKTRLPRGMNGPVRLAVVDVGSGQEIAWGHGAPEEGDANAIYYQISLSPDLFDGRPHAFSVRLRDHAVSLQSIAVVMPYMATPESALLQYAREGLSPSLSTAAGFRYESLAQTAAYLPTVGSDVASSGMSIAERLAQVSRAHEALARGFSATDKIYDPIVFPEYAEPLVSIVIPVHNKFHITYHCLASLVLAHTRATFEVVLVDDGSSDRTTSIPELIKGIQYLRHEKAQGFIRSCNFGGSHARGRYIVMLNNDTEVTAGWLDELLWPFEHFDGVGMTGAKLLYADGTLQEAGGIVWNTGNPWNYGRNRNARDPRYNYARQTDYLSGACLMLPTKLWSEIGGFSEEFLPAYFEDTDLCFQVRSRGFKTVYTPMAQVFHFEGKSNGTDVTSGIKRFQEVNRPKFKARWHRACRSNGDEGVDVEIAKDRNVDHRALVIDNQMPMPDKDAGGFAAVQEMRMLQGLGFKCTFIPQNLAWMGKYTTDLQRMGIETLYAPFYTSVEQVLAERGSEFDLVYITRYYVAQNHIEKIRRLAPRAKIVLMNADLHFLRELREAIQSKDPEKMSKSLRTRDEELAVMRQVDLVLAYTDVEKAVILSHNLDSTKVERCPWVENIATEVPGFDAREGIGFLGGFGHAPNAEAVEWFVSKVMPNIRRQLPGVKFRVFGSAMSAEMMARLEAQPDVVVEGWVQSTRDCYDRCRVFVAPLLTGAGIKGKVIGALSSGIPTVMSPVAAEGIAAADGQDAFIATDPTQWSDAVAKLYTDRDLWTRVSANALGMARRQFGFESAVAQMRQALLQIDLYTSDTNNALSARN